MSIVGKKIAILVDNYFEQAEFEEPLRQLGDAGAVVKVVAMAQKKLHGMQHVKIGDAFTADVLLADASYNEFDALVLPGGVINADHLRMDEKAREWVRDFMSEDKLIAAICHAPWLLASASVTQGRTLTSYYTLQDDLRNAGASWVDKTVVVDGNLITSRKPDDIPAFVQAIRQWFENT